MTNKALLYAFRDRDWYPLRSNDHDSLNVSLSAGGEDLIADDRSEALVTIDFAHHEIHEGEFFSTTYKTPDGSDLADNGTISFVISTNEAFPHLLAFGACGGDTELALYENPDFDADGIDVNQLNHNRASSNVSLVDIVRDATINDNGTRLEDVFLPGGTGGNAIGESGGQRNEWILNRNTDYLVLLTNLAGNAQPGFLSLQWYE